MRNKTLANACFGCTVCKPEPKHKGALLTWGQSSPEAKVLVLSGPVAFTESSVLDSRYVESARSVFMGTVYANIAAEIFGSKWLDNPRYIASSATRCDHATVGHRDEVSLACSVYTRQLMRNVTGVFTIGNLAKAQLLAILGVDELMSGTIVRISNWVVAAADALVDGGLGFGAEFNRKVDES